MAYYPLRQETDARYLLIAPDGTTAAINDEFDNDYVGMLTEITGIDGTDIRESAEDLTEADGGAHGYFYMGRRSISMSGRTFGHVTALERDTRLDKLRRATMALRGDAALTWKPATRLENLAINPKFAFDLNTWGSSISAGYTSTTLTRVAPPDDATAWAYRVQGTAPADTTARTASIVTTGVANRIRVKPNQTYTLAMDAYVTDAPSGTVTATGSIYIEPWIQWMNAAGANIGTTAQTRNSGNRNTWWTVGGRARRTFTVTAPSTAVTCQMGATIGTATSGDTFDVYFTNFRLSEGTDGTYMDGDTAGWYWHGTVDASPSGDYVEMYTPVRRQSPFRVTGAWVKEWQLGLVSEYAPVFSNQVVTTPTQALGAITVQENQGNWASYPIMRLTGAVTNPTVTIGSTVFKTTGLVLAAGETVEFDMLNHTGRFTAGARSGQSANRYIDFATTAWPSLAMGTQNVTHGGTANSGSTLQLVYRHAWA